LFNHQASNDVMPLEPAPARKVLLIVSGSHRQPGHRGPAEGAPTVGDSGRGSHRGTPAEDLPDIAARPRSHRGTPAPGETWVKPGNGSHRGLGEPGAAPPKTGASEHEPRRHRGTPTAAETPSSGTAPASAQESAAGKHARRVIAPPAELGDVFEVDGPAPVHRRPRRRPSLGRALRWTALSVLIPGIGHLASGRRRLGMAIVATFGALLITATVLALAVPHSRWVRVALKPDDLVAVMSVCGVLGLIWAGVVASSWWVARPSGMGPAQRVIGTSVAATLSLGIAAPFAFGARTAYVQYDLLNDIFSAPMMPVVQPKAVVKPVGFGPSHGIFAGKQRVNVLLLGGDGGKDRTGVRTDSMILASIDTITGSTVLISLPRNMMDAPFLPGTPMAKRFPNGFDDMLNAVYRYGTDHPEVMPGTPFPGGELIKQSFAYTIGQNIDYFVLVNLAGFADLVDAIGGVTMTVPRPLPIGGRHDGHNKVITPPTGYLQPGHRKLSGYEALWYGRSRFDSDDYSRMARQRCLLTAIAHQASPLTVLTNFSKLAGAARQIILTDIPMAALPDLYSLAGKAKQAKVTDVSIVRNAQFDPAHPDFAYIQKQVQAALTASQQPPAPRPAGVVVASRDHARQTKAGSVMKTAAKPKPKPAAAAAPADPGSC
jgi:LCP family protein required for cell wall assembly